MNHPRILGIGTANPTVRLTQEQSFVAAGYQGERTRKIFLNSDIDYRHFHRARSTALLPTQRGFVEKIFPLNAQRYSPTVSANHPSSVSETLA